jgi:hypothetical protein
MRRRIKAKQGIVRQLDPTDPRNLNHPSHKEQWLELARSVGRSLARTEYARLNKRQPEETSRETSNEDTAKDRCDVRPLFK